jgi:hypothetical protein
MSATMATTGYTAIKSKNRNVLYNGCGQWRRQYDRRSGQGCRTMSVTTMLTTERRSIRVWPKGDKPQGGCTVSAYTQFTILLLVLCWFAERKNHPAVLACDVCKPVKSNIYSKTYIVSSVGPLLPILHTHFYIFLCCFTPTFTEFYTHFYRFCRATIAAFLDHFRCGHLTCFLVFRLIFKAACIVYILHCCWFTVCFYHYWTARKASGKPMKRFSACWMLFVTCNGLKPFPGQSRPVSVDFGWISWPVFQHL